jgi:hypothetical protein
MSAIIVTAFLIRDLYFRYLGHRRPGFTPIYIMPFAGAAIVADLVSCNHVDPDAPPCNDTIGACTTALPTELGCGENDPEPALSSLCSFHHPKRPVGRYACDPDAAVYDCEITALAHCGLVGFCCAS